MVLPAERASRLHHVQHAGAPAAAAARWRGAFPQLHPPRVPSRWRQPHADGEAAAGAAAAQRVPPAAGGRVRPAVGRHSAVSEPLPLAQLPTAPRFNSKFVQGLKLHLKFQCLNQNEVNGGSGWQ